MWCVFIIQQWYLLRKSDTVKCNQHVRNISYPAQFWKRARKNNNNNFIERDQKRFCSAKWCFFYHFLFFWNGKTRGLCILSLLWNLWERNQFKLGACSSYFEWQVQILRCNQISDVQISCVIQIQSVLYVMPPYLVRSERLYETVRDLKRWNDLSRQCVREYKHFQIETFSSDLCAPNTRYADQIKT